ncbi:hypothetical protein ABZV91_18370 [Nocardia sp. NPDC004568]|uniref:hypothetical protein n=1 Tax=Nocardia sp. NPDC004568 TaxID=3154551 RepID=UPI0033A3E36A
MSSEKPVSDPQEPEGTGVPADAAAEHAPSGNDETDAATGRGAAESGADKSGDPDAETAVAGESTPAAGDAPADRAGSDATVALNKAESTAEKVDTAKKPAGATEAEPEADKESVAAGAGAAAKPARRRSPFPLPALVGAAVLLVAALVAVGVFFFLAGNKQEELDRRAAATKAACDFGNNFATYTGDKADDYIQRLDRSATGEWKKLVSQIGPDLKTRFAESKVSSTATGVQCGYESGSGDEARVVLVIDQQFTTANVPQEQGPGQVKVAANVSMQKIDGTWLVADFDTPMMQ